MKTRATTIATAVILLLFVSCTASSQKNVVQQMTQQREVGFPKLEITENGQKKQLRLSELSVDISVTGNIATTTMDMTFFNGTSRILEGELDFPLAEGQTISRYALDINGRMREGVVVEKAKGRKTFESIERRRVDPGLVEMTRGNNFRTRIYPIPAMGSRRVIIAYEQELQSVKSDKYYILPFQVNEIVDKFAIRVQVLKQEHKPEITENPFSDFAFDKWQENYQASFSAVNYSLGKTLSFRLPDVPDHATVYTEDEGYNTYFYLSSLLETDAPEKKLPKDITLIFDISSSAETRDIQKEMKLLESYLAKTGKAKIRIVTFSNEIHSDTEIQYSGDFSVIAGIVNKFRYDGGTQLGCLDLTKYKCEEIILFTDGLSNFGKKEPVRSSTPLMLINSNASADHSFMQKLARSNNGNYVNLKALTTEQGLTTLCSNPFRLIRADYNADEIKELYPKPGTIVTGSFSLAGITTKKTTSVTLHFGFGSTITKSMNVSISTLGSAAPANVKRLWAQKKLAELDIDYDRNKDEITSLAKKHSIVTRNTSLIVLDRVEDYVQYEITPPAELLDEYNRLMGMRPKQVAPDTTHIPESVIEAFKEYLTWWNTDFSRIKPVVQKNKSAVAAGMASDTISLSNDEAPMLMMSMADVVEERREVQLGMAQNIVAADMAISYDKKEDGQTRRNEAEVSTITLQAWNPNADYIAALKHVEDTKMYELYMELKTKYRESPSFYMDVADYFGMQGLKAEALTILSNLAELKMEDAEMMRSLGNKLVEMKKYDVAVDVFTEVLAMREEEPQAYRDLALVCHQAGQDQRAVNLLYHVIRRNWDPRFEGIQIIALNEMNAIISGSKAPLNTSAIDPQVLKATPVDIRIVMTWNTNDCDMDLWVTDPKGEICNYSHNRTVIGGRLSRDITQGYGPEEFCLRNAVNGNYKIEVNYYGTSNQHMLQPVVVQAEVYTHFGTKEEKKQVLTLRLESAKNTLEIGTINFSNAITK